MVEADNSKNSVALQAAQNGNVPYGTELMNDRDGGQILVKKQYVITGERINGAEPAFDSQSNQPIVRVSTMVRARGRCAMSPARTSATAWRSC